MKQQTVMIIAHRGASALASHENTLEAFQIAIDLKVDMAELDVRRTKDETLIVFHDACIQGREIGGLTYKEINEIAQKENYRVPMFSEVLALCKGKIGLDIELKERGFEREVVDMVCKRFGYDYGQFSIKSFLDEVSLTVKTLDSRITTGLLVGRTKADVKVRLSEYFPERRLRACRADFISPYFQFVTKDFVHRMKRKGYPIYVWTVNDENMMIKYGKRGVQGIITDYPNVGLQVREQYLKDDIER